MAVKNIDSVKLDQNTKAVVTLTAATSQADGVAIDFTEVDERTVILVQNAGSSAASFKIEKGDGIQGVKDYESGNIAGGAIVVINCESGRFKKLYGEHKGKLRIIPSSTDLKFAAVVLP